MAICRAKGVPLFLSHFKTLSVGPVPTDWARPCLGFYYISALFLFNLAKISFNLKIPKRDLKQTAYIYRLKCAKRLLSFFHIKNKKLEYVILQFSIIYLTVSNYSKIPTTVKYPKIKEPVQPAWQRKVGSYAKQSFQFWWSKLSILIVWETFDKRLLCICFLWIIFVWIVTRSLFP